jgi:chromosome segregation protein
MKLEKVIIHGFKSFADKTELHFNQPITAIVGPNGCGKSNVVDAIKWVLGNQSPKSLRSGQMADVIFSGCSSRKPSSLAEVVLCFCNVQQPGFEQDNLEISRRLYRSGESEYLINNKSCRLRDIKNLFLDTGVGVNAYSIIEQGQIEQLLRSSSTDRRLIFEEAAGISKFKMHKKEALRKLERTEQNLLRLADIVNEVQKQLRSIKLQAGKARNYLEYSQQLKELRVNYSLSEYHKIVTSAQEKNSILEDWQEQFASAAATVARHDAATGNLAARILETETCISRWDNILVAARSRIEQQNERIHFQNAKINELSERKSSAISQERKFREQIRQLDNELRVCTQEAEQSQKEMTVQSEYLASIEDTLTQVNRQFATWQAKLDDEKSGVIDMVRRTAQLHNEIQSLNHYRDNLAGQKTRLFGRASQAQEQLAQWLIEKAQNQAKHKDILAILSEMQSSLETKRAEMETVGDHKTATLNKLSEARQNRSALTSEVNILRDMEQRRQGVSSAIKTILKDRSTRTRADYIEGIVADVLSAETPYAAAVEAALEGRTDTLLVNSTRRFLEDETIHEKLDGRLSVLCMDRIEPFSNTDDFSEEPGVTGRLVEFVKFDSAYAPLAWHLLGRIILVESLNTAMELSVRYGKEYRFVTPTGQVLLDGCILNTGPVGKASGLISRKSRITQLQEEMAALNEQIQILEQHLQQAEHKNEHLDEVCKELRTSIYEANTEKIDVESRLRMVEQNIKRLGEEQPVLTGEIQLLEEEIHQSVQKEHDSRQKLEELEEINAQRNARIEELQRSMESERQTLQSHNARATELKILIGRIGEQQKSIRQRIATLNSQLQQARTAAESSRTEMIACNEQIEQTQRQILSTESSLCSLYVEKEQAQKESIGLHGQQEDLSRTQKENEQLLRTARQEQAEVEQHIHQLQMELSQLSVKEEDLCQRVKEELQMELAESYKNYQQQETDWDAVREQIAELRGKIERLGNVNVDAIDQQEQLEERYQFLATQAEDLNQSKSQLEQLIERINKESREKFQTTFEQVRIHFQELFRKLFGGGKADIFLENPDDILDSGIEIVARPPGKENRAISLLSGGEKSMTAIALLFAVFLSKPSPFCILDEVDAALDEANNERFNLIVKQFHGMSQFIIITHSKRTMSIADMLYGVTMQTQGISKKISVQFEHGNVKDASDDSPAAVA